MKLSVGVRVMCVNLADRGGKLNGLTGTVISESYYKIGVMFDKFMDGHNCNGERDCKYGYGWYIPKGNLVPLVANIR